MSTISKLYRLDMLYVDTAWVPLNFTSKICPELRT